MSAQYEQRDLLSELLEESYNDPAFFFQACLRVDHLRTWQRRTCDRIKAQLEAGEKHPRVLIRTCHTAGKTFFAAGILLWWMTTRYNSRGVTTAQTWDQIETVLWPEIGQLFEKSIFYEIGFGRLLNTELHFAGSTPDRPQTWFAKGSSSDRPARMEGQHSPTAVIRVIDEAKEVEDAVFVATAGFLAAPMSMDLWISTPSVESGQFFKRDVGDKPCIREVVTIDDLLADPALTKDELDYFRKWKEEHLQEWGGEDTEEYRTRALAQYADNSEGALFPSSWTERAYAKRCPAGCDHKPGNAACWTFNGVPIAGMDVAGSVDGDQSAVALCYREGDRVEIRELQAWHERDTMKSKGRAISIAKPVGAPLRVDTIGIGKGVADAIRQDNYPVREYRASERPYDAARFNNRKSEDAWVLRQLLEKGQVRISITDPVMAQKLKSQMRAMKYEIMQSGKTRVVDPEDSPDLVDAVIIASASPRDGFTTIGADDFFGRTF